MIKAVIFDLGGVYFEDGTKKLIAELREKTGKQEEIISELFKKGKSVDYRENKISGTEFFTWVAGQLDNQFAPEEINLMWVSKYVEIPGIKEIILDLKKRGLKVGILSDNVPERINYLQDKYNFLDLFDDVVLSYEVNLTKPSKEIFDLAVSRLGIKAEEAVFVDDKQPNVDGAISSGLSGFLFTSVDNLRVDLEKITNIKV